MRGKLIVVIDDDPLIIDAMRGLLRGWGCRVIAAESESELMASVAGDDRQPDLIIADYQLGNGHTGIQTIHRLRSEFRAPIPAFLITGDIAPERLNEASANGLHLLHKPVGPMALRAMLNQVLRLRVLPATQNVGGNVHAAGKDQAQRAEHDLTRR